MPQVNSRVRTGPSDAARRNAAIEGVQAGQKLVYAVRRPDGLIKIGCTRNLAQRLRHLGDVELLGFVPGGFDRELAIHHQLAGFTVEGREVYEPAPDVMFVVNQMRQDLGLEALGV